MAAPILSSFAVTALTTGADIPITAPSGIVSGDLIIVYLEHNSSSTTWTAPDSTWIQRESNAGGTGTIFTKISSGSEPASWTFTRSLNLNNAGGHAVRISNPGPYATGSLLNRGARTSAELPSVTATTSNTLLLQFIYDFGGAGTPFTGPGTATEVYDAARGVIGHEVVNAGATGTRTWTYAGNSNSGAAIVAVAEMPAASNTLQRANSLYPVNFTTVTSGSGVDIRLLSDTEPGATDSTQTIAVTTQGTNAERTFDPATASTGTNNAATTLAKLGWSFRLSDMTTAGSACNAYIAAQNCTISFIGAASGTGSGATGANDVLTPRASLWKYNLSTNTGTLIVGGSGTAISKSALSTYNNSAYSASVTLSVPATSFTSEEVLYVQLGGNLACGAGLAGGARTTTWSLSVDVSTTNVAFSSIGVRNLCSFSNNINSLGSPTKNGLAIASKNYSINTRGTLSYTKATTASKTFSLSSPGIASRDSLLAVILPRDLTARGEILTSGSNATTITIPIADVPKGGEDGRTYIFPILD